MSVISYAKMIVMYLIYGVVWRAMDFVVQHVYDRIVAVIELSFANRSQQEEQMARIEQINQYKSAPDYQIYIKTHARCVNSVGCGCGDTTTACTSHVVEKLLENVLLCKLLFETTAVT